MSIQDLKDVISKSALSDDVKTTLSQKLDTYSELLKTDSAKAARKATVFGLIAGGVVGLVVGFVIHAVLF